MTFFKKSNINLPIDLLAVGITKNSFSQTFLETLYQFIYPGPTIFYIIVVINITSTYARSIL